MAKKKIPRQSVQWTHEDLVESLAWLDHTVQHDDINFQETVVHHLKQSRLKEFTLTQIEAKLRGLWTKYGIDDPSRKSIGWKDDVFTSGSSCIVGLSIEEQEDTASRLRDLEAGYDATHPCSSHRLRRRSRPTNTGSSYHLNFESSESSRNSITAHSRYRTHTLSLTPSTVKREGETSGRSPREAASGKRKRATPSRHVTVTKGFEQLSPTPRLARATIRKQVLPATTSASIVHDSEEDEEERGSEPRVLAPESIGQGDPLNHREPEDGHGACENQEPSKIYKIKLETAVAEIECLRELLHQKDVELRDQEENTRMAEDRVAVLESVQSQQNRQDGGSVTLLIQKDRSIQDLQRELNERRFLGRFTKLLPSSREFFGEENGGTNFVEGFHNIYSESKQILCRHEGSTAVTSSLFDRHQNLRLLVCRGLGIDLHIPLKIDKSVLDLSKLSLQAIVRALMTSAIREWIFETDFPTFSTESSKVLLRYREHLAKQDGANCVRNLDLAAHNSLIKDVDFRRGLPEKANNFAVQLSQTLAPIFTQDTGVVLKTAWDGFATWDQDLEEWRERRVRLVDIFTKALEVKADSILNTVDYEMVIYSPGTKYDKNTMAVETIDGMIDPGDHYGRTIELCIEAAVFLYPRRDLQDSATTSEAIVTSRNFVRKEASQRIGVTPIVKAVVVLKDEHLNDLGS